MGAPQHWTLRTWCTCSTGNWVCSCGGASQWTSAWTSALPTGWMLGGAGRCLCTTAHLSSMCSSYPHVWPLRCHMVSRVCVWGGLPYTVSMLRIYSPSPRLCLWAEAGWCQDVCVRVFWRWSCPRRRCSRCHELCSNTGLSCGVLLVSKLVQYTTSKLVSMWSVN